MKRCATVEESNHFREDFDDFWRLGRLVVPPLLFFAVIITVATAGYIQLGWRPFDAFYMVIISVFSVGYGEIQPIDTVTERLWTILVIIGGWVGVILTLGSVVQAVSRGELRRTSETIRKHRAMEHLSNHVIICGYGRMGQTLANELAASKFPFVVIDRDEERIAQVGVDGFLCLRGDATEESILIEAGVTRAAHLATVLPQDALNVFITLTARDLSENIRIIARGEQLSTEKKLLQAGANEVILPATIGARRIAHSITEPTVMSLLGQGAMQFDWHRLGLEVEELRIHEHAHLIGNSVADVQRMGMGNVMVLGVRRGDEVQREALDGVSLQADDVLIVLSRERNLPEVLSSSVERTKLF